MSSPELKHEIKALMVEELMLKMTADEIGDETPIFGPEGLGMDSVDALQLVVALEKRFGLRLSEGDEAKRVLHSVQSMADEIERRRAP